MELRHIRYFMAVAEERNFTKAAEKLCIAQPPLSRQIQDLENELGTKLLIRKPHDLQLTEEGMLFLQYAVQIMELVEKSQETIHEMAEGLQGTLYLALVEGHAPRLVSKWIAGFHKRYPRVQYQLWNGNSDDVSNRVAKGLCDLAVIMEPHNGEGLESLPVYEEPWIAMIPGKNPLAQKEEDTIELSELLPYDLIIPSRESRLQEINGWFERTGKKPKVICRVAHTVNAYELARNGVGISIYPAAAADIADQQAVCIKRLIHPSVTASYILVWSRAHRQSLVAEEFIRYVRKEQREGALCSGI